MVKMVSPKPPNNGAAYFIIVVLVIMCVGAIIWALWARSDLIHCQTTEHPACPSYFCARTHKSCVPHPSAYVEDAGAAFRTDSKGNIQCQTPTLDPAVSDVDANGRKNW